MSKVRKKSSKHTVGKTRRDIRAEIQEDRKQVKLTRADLHDYQVEARQFAYETKKCGLFLEMGIGKTVITGTLIADLLDNFEVNRVLIIGPRRVAKVTWPDEFREWDHLCGYKVLPAIGNPKQRLAALNSGYPIVSINRENISWLVDYYKGKWPFDMVVIDESSSFKSHESKRFKDLVKVRPLIKRLIELTATPSGESYTSFFSQIFLLDGGKRFGKDFNKFRDKYFNYNQYNHTITPKEDTEHLILNEIKDICMVMRTEDYLGQNQYDSRVIPVRLDKKQTKLYTDFRTSLVMMVPDSDNVVVEAESAAILAQKSLQMCSGVIYNTYYDGVTENDVPIRKTDIYDLHEEKLDALEVFLEEAKQAGKNVFLGYHFKSSRKRILARFPDIVEMDKDGNNIKKWNAGGIKVYMAHPQSAGHGLNLQRGGHTILFYDIPYSFENYDQFIGRLDRQGQKHKVTVYHLVSVGTSEDGKDVKLADRYVYENLKRKETNQDWALKTLRDLRKAMKRKMRNG